ncbi:MAG: DNA (cytosine-5-)-methyltransferase [Bdellovibrionales bacterium]|nr:DNA (cytosine-5-)-methyltransferase [Bdellovibrionales bacterium]
MTNKITYNENFNDIPLGDIRELSYKIIPDHEILLAGFPCQPFSYSGYKKGFKDDRGTLFFEILRILKNKKPKSFLLENVKGLTSLNEGKILKSMILSLEDLGYSIYQKVLNTKNYGNTPQTRERIYIVGFRDKVDFKFPQPIKLNKGISDLLLKKNRKAFFIMKVLLFTIF